jgi:hypothetical protein
MGPYCKPYKLGFMDSGEYGIVLPWWNDNIKRTLEHKQQSCKKCYILDIRKY